MLNKFCSENFPFNFSPSGTEIKHETSLDYFNYFRLESSFVFYFPSVKLDCFVCKNAVNILCFIHIVYVLECLYNVLKTTTSLLFMQHRVQQFCISYKSVNLFFLFHQKVRHLISMVNDASVRYSPKRWSIQSYFKKKYFSVHYHSYFHPFIRCQNA